MLGLAPLNALRAFEASARRGSFAAAAQELNVTPAAVGQQVRQLEALIGAPLFERIGRSLQLTDRGAEALPSLQRGFELVGEASAALRQPRATSTITLAAPAELLSAWIARDVAHWPAEGALTFQVMAADLTSTQAFDNGADLVLTRSRSAGPDSVRLMDEIVTPLTAPTLALRGSGFDRLLNAPLIADESLDLSWSQWAAARGAFGEGLKPAIQAPDSLTALALAAEGAGVLLARKSLALDAIRAGTLTPVLADGDLQTDAGYTLQIAPDSTSKPAVAALANHLKRCASARLDTAGEL